jgi:hypothetical protein
MNDSCPENNTIIYKSDGRLIHTFYKDINYILTMRMPPESLPFMHYGLAIESVYSLIVVVACLLIYFETRELYNLTSYKGIKYFRNTFLFFGITYFIRFCLSLVSTLRINPVLFNLFRLFEFSLFIMVYTSSMALIYCIYSIFWKGLKKYRFSNVYLFHALALLIAFLTVIRVMPSLFLIFQSILFLVLIIVSYIKYKHSKHDGSFAKLYLIYFLIFALWIVSSIMAFVFFIAPILGLVIYIISIALFLVILFRVIRKLKGK